MSEKMDHTENVLKIMNNSLIDEMSKNYIASKEVILFGCFATNHFGFGI